MRGGEQHNRSEDASFAQGAAPYVGQTLGGWRNKPSGTEDEPYADELQFIDERHEHLVFRLYRADGHPDWLAIERITGTVRRFVDVTLNMVLEDLAGIRPAPKQEDVESRWGKPAAPRTLSGSLDRLAPRHDFAVLASARTFRCMGSSRSRQAAGACRSLR